VNVTQRTPRWAAILLGLLLLAAACSGNPEPNRTTSPPTSSATALTASVASYELLSGEPNRFIVGLLANPNPEDTFFVSFGIVNMAFSYLGTADAPQDPQPGPQADGVFLAVPGTVPEAEAPAGPVMTSPSEGRGVYAAYDVTFDRAGFWQVEVTAEVADTGTLSATAAFEVLQEPLVPAPGQPALETENLTLDSTDVPAEAIDSRGGGGGEIPDPELHQWTIARAIQEGRPALVVFSTPVWCISKFCGPVTDVVADLADRYADRAVFIHVEFWRDFQNQVVNQAAADWLFHNDTLQEPWLFLIGADGIIQARWDNLFTLEEVEPMLEALPPMRA
jgi:hypothetical protein